jgi:hypothetical protein
MPHARTPILAPCILTIAFLSAMAMTPEVSAATTPEQDFAARCAAPGVLVCQGFDDSSIFTYSPTQTQGVYPIWGTTTLRIYQDTSIKASGTSSMRFDIPSQTDADASGHFEAAFGQNFGAHSTFYVQYHAMFDATLAYTNWDTLAGTSPKISIFYDGNGSSCANVELTSVQYYGSGIPMMYSECGARHLFTSTSDISSYTSSTPLLVQQGSSSNAGYDCQYGQLTPGTGNGPGCYKLAANTWYTWYFKVSIGDWGQPNSSIQAFVSVNGGPYVEWINVRNYTLNQDGPGSAFNRIMLTPYMTNMSSAIVHPTAHAWYDELIVSTQAIAAPGAASASPTTPDPPTNLVVN